MGLWGLDRQSSAGCGRLLKDFTGALRVGIGFWVYDQSHVGTMREYDYYQDSDPQSNGLMAVWTGNAEVRLHRRKHAERALPNLAGTWNVCRLSERGEREIERASVVRERDGGKESKAWTVKRASSERRWDGGRGQDSGRGLEVWHVSNNRYSKPAVLTQISKDL